MNLSAVRIAPDSADEAGMFEVVHPFHPCFGQRLRLVTVRHNWDEARAYYHDSQGRLMSIPTRWTDLAASDPFVVLSAGRSAFRVEDLLELVRLLEGLREGVGDVR
jgi:hypothetical protein